MSPISSRHGAARLASALLLGCALLPAAHADVVISQVYGGGGNSGATWTHDFVELFNDGDTAVSVDGWTVQYASSAGSSWQKTVLSGSLQPGQYYLVQQAKGSGGTTALPTPDAIGGISMAGASGKVALVANGTSLAGTCPLDATVDFVGFGSANCSLGAGAVPTLNNTTAGIRNDGGCANTRSNVDDFSRAAPAPRNSATTLAPCSGPGLAQLSIDDVALEEGNSGSRIFTFTVSLDATAANDVSFDIATVDAQAMAGSDYTAHSATLTIGAGQTSTSFDVAVSGDTAIESDEAFHVDLSNPVGAIIGRGRGVGTIVNDDAAPLLPISAVQGAGIGSSPWLGSKVQIEGVITALRTNGYFVQTAPGEDDGDGTTAEGLFVFSGSAGAPADAVVGHRVRVQGTVTQFARTPHGYPLTQLGFASLTVLAEGQGLPAAVELSDEDLSPTATINRLGRYQGMRVTLPAARVVNASNAFGDFYVTLPQTARPFREPGIALLDAVPLPEGNTLPRFDMNAERLRVESLGLLGANRLDVDNGTELAGLDGVMYYDRGDFTLLLGADAPAVSGGLLPIGAPAPADNTVSIAGFNIENLSGGANASITRLSKLSAVFCEALNTPDIVGVTEIGNLETLQRVASAINGNEFGHCPDSPGYVAHLLSSQGSQRLGFLVSTREVRPGQPRVEVLEIAEEAANDPFVDPAGGVSSAPLFDRAPLRLTAVVHDDSGEQFPLTVIANHLLSLLDVNSLSTRNDAWETAGNRSRHKRLYQAVRLGQIVQARQDADPSERIVLLGDFNAFEFNDGYVDVMGIITGYPATPDQVLVWADTPVTRPLLNMALTLPQHERYSYVHVGNAQVLDHMLVNDALLEAGDAELHYVHMNTDFAEDNEADAGVPVRSSDHDPALLYVGVPTFAQVDLGVTVSGPRTPIVNGRSGEFVVTIGNGGSDAAWSPELVVEIDAAAAGVQHAGLAGWDCALTSTGTDSSLLRCSTDALWAAGSTGELRLQVAPRRTSPQTFLGLRAQIGSRSSDGNAANDSAEVSVRVVGKPG